MRGLALAKIAATDSPESAFADWVLARRSIERAIAIDPQFAEAHAELGDVAEHLQNDQAALDHWTTALRLKPDDRRTYAFLAALYVRLGLLDYATRVLEQGITWGDSYELRTIYAQVKGVRHDNAGAIEQLSLAKQACGNCNEAGQAAVYFFLGRAQSNGTSAEKSQAIRNLQTFFKMICKGAAASRYADQCSKLSTSRVASPPRRPAQLNENVLAPYPPCFRLDFSSLVRSTSCPPEDHEARRKHRGEGNGHVPTTQNLNSGERDSGTESCS